MALWGAGNMHIARAYISDVESMKLKIACLCRSEKAVNPEELELLVDQLVELENRLNR